LTRTLLSCRAHQLEDRIALGLGREDDGLVFCEADGQPLRPGWVTAEFRHLVKTSGLPTISLHGLRHSHAAHLVASDAHVRAIVERVGHSKRVVQLGSLRAPAADARR
jgi:site-specific recombinase XerD